MHNIFGTIENLIELRPDMGELVVEKTKILQLLLDRVSKKVQQPAGTHRGVGGWGGSPALRHAIHSGRLIAVCGAAATGQGVPC